MKIKTMLACASVAVSPCAFAQSSVTLYGLIDEGVAYVNHVAPSASAAGQRVFSTTSYNESRWGLYGSEDLGNGLHGIFRLENGFNIGNGTMGDGGRLFGRQAYVGLDSDRYGRLTLGRQYDFSVVYVGPFASSKQWAGAFGSHVGDSDNLYNSFRLNNAAKYVTPAFHGFQAGAAYAFSNQGGDDGAGFANNRAYTFGAKYHNGPFAAAAAYVQLSDPVAGNTGGSNTAGAIAGDYANIRNVFYSNVARQRIASGAASYTLGAAKASLVYSWVGFNYADGTALHLSNYEVNASYNITPALLVGAAFVYTEGSADGGQSHGSFANGNGPNWRQVNLGLDYALSKRTDLYSVFVWQRAGGDAQQAAIFNSGGLSGATSRQQILVTAGVRTKF